MRAICIIIFFLFFTDSYQTFAQAPDTLWTKIIGTEENEGVNDVQQTYDGGFIMVGVSDGLIYLVKTNDNGEIIWEKTYSGPTSSGHQGYSVEQTTDGGYIIVARITMPGVDDYDVRLIKTDENGNVVWTTTWGGENDDVGRSVRPTSDGGYIVAGHTFTGISPNHWDILLIKTDQDGNISWTKTYGGTYPEKSYSVQQTNDGGYIIAGARWIDGNFEGLYVIKTDGEGNIIWERNYVENGRATYIEKTNDGGYIITGWTNEPSTANDFLLIKIDSNGDSLWTKTYHWDGPNSSDRAYMVQQTSDNGFIVGGYTYKSVALIKTDANGDSVWAKKMNRFDVGGQQERGYAVRQTFDNGYIVAAVTRQAPGDHDIWLIRLDAYHPRNVNILLPNGGEDWQIGTQQEITWTAENVEFVDIEYSTNAGSTWEPPIATNYDATLGSFTWTIPNTPSNNCLVRILDSTNPEIGDISDDAFTISEYNLWIELTVPFTEAAPIPSEFFDRTPLGEQNKFLFEIILRTNETIEPPLENLKIEAFIDGSPIELKLQSALHNFDINPVDGKIDTFPTFKSPNRIELLALSDAYVNNQPDKNIEIILSEINGVSTNITYNDQTSLYFAKQDNPNRGYSLMIDSYSFDNLTHLTLREVINYLLNNPDIFGFMTIFYNELNVKDGRCFGLAASSGAYFVNPNLKPMGGNVHSWPNTNTDVLDNINKYFIIQNFYDYGKDYSVSLQYDKMINIFMEQKPVVLGLQNSNGKHAILASRIILLNNNNRSYISVYENNKADSSYTDYVDFTNNSYRHITLDYTYNEFTVFEPEEYMETSIIAALNWWIAKVWRNLANLGSKVFGIACPVHLLVENSQGQRVGYLDNGTFVNEITGSQVFRSPTYEGNTDSLTLIYVPDIETYTVEMNSYDSGIMLFEHLAAQDTSTLLTASIDSVDITTTTVCHFDELTPNILSVDYDGDGNIDTTLSVKVEIITGIEEDNATIEIPTNYSLEQNYPNPFNPTTKIKYHVPEITFISLKVYNVLGKEMATLVNEEKETGIYEVEFDATGLPSGIYFYKLQAGSFAETKKMILLK